MCQNISEKVLKAGSLPGHGVGQVVTDIGGAGGDQGQTRQSCCPPVENTINTMRVDSVGCGG